MSIDLGIPLPPPQVLAPRRKTRQILLKHPTHPVAVGGDAPISVQSMCTTLTADVDATLQQIAELTASGCQVVRVAVPKVKLGWCRRSRGLGARRQPLRI